MALIECKDCGKKFSSDAKCCIHCGARRPISWRKMGWTVAAMTGLFFYFDSNDKESTHTRHLESPCKTDWHACKDNADLINNYEKFSSIRVECEMATRNKARFGDADLPWLAFSNYNKGDAYIRYGKLYAYEPNAKLQNMYGAYERTAITCVYDLKESKVVNIILGE